MQLAHIHHRVGSRFVVSRVVMAVFAMGLIALTGCDTHLFDLDRSLFDPAELGRYNQKPLVMPILNSLGTGYDVSEPDFPTATDVRPEDLKPVSQDYIIGKNDLLAVSITELVGPGIETVKQVRVSESGNVSLPYLSNVKAAGLTESQLEGSIIEQYKANHIIQNAQVSVTVIEARQRVFSILGAVARTGQYAILSSDFRVLDALVVAGDISIPNTDYLYVVRPPNPNLASTQPTTVPAVPLPTPRNATPGGPDLIDPDAAPTPPTVAPASRPATAPTSRPIAQRPTGEETPTVFIAGANNTTSAWSPKPGETRKPASRTSVAPVMDSPRPRKTGTVPFEFNAPLPTTESRIIRVPVDRLIYGDLRYNIIIRPNDTIMVPFPHTGEYFMGGHVQRSGVYSLTGRAMTLKQAIVSAGMLDQLAVPAHTDVIRRIGKDHEIYVRVNLEKIWDGTLPDIFLKPNDVIQVGTSGYAPFLAAFRNAFRLTYGFGFIYDKNFESYYANRQYNNNNNSSTTVRP